MEGNKAVSEDDSRRSYRRRLDEQREETRHAVEEMEIMVNTIQKQLEELRLRSGMLRQHKGRASSVSSGCLVQLQARRVLRRSTAVVNAEKSKDLLRAGKHGKLDICWELLTGAEASDSEFSLDVNCCDKEGRSCLIHLISKLEEDDDAFEDKREVLHEAIAKIVEQGGDVNHCDFRGCSALWLACSAKEPLVLSTLVRTERPQVVASVKSFSVTFANPNKLYVLGSGGEHRKTLWELCIERESAEMLEELLEAQKILEVNWRTALGDPSDTTWTKQSCRAMNPGAWDEKGSPLHLVFSLNVPDDDRICFLEKLVDQHPVDQDSKDGFVTMFYPNATDVNGRTALHLACEMGLEESIEPLLKYKHKFGRKWVGEEFDVNLKDKQSYTPLMSAIVNGHTGVVKQLFERNDLGKERNHNLSLRAGRHSMTALHLACDQKEEMEEVVALLCRYKAQVNLKDNRGRSPLHIASEHGHIMIVKMLLKYNANAASQDNKGETALHVAAKNGHINILSILLRKGGAEVHTENLDGKTALHHAFDRHKLINDAIFAHPALRDGEIEHHISIQDQMVTYRSAIEAREKNFKAGTDRSKMLDRFRNIELKLRHQIKGGSQRADEITIKELREKSIEHLFLDISNQDMLIKLLLDEGADLDREDIYGVEAFTTTARFDWFDVHEGQMTQIFDQPDDIGYDSEIFTDKRTQKAVHTIWVLGGMRFRAVCKLIGWLLFVTLFTIVAARYSGRNAYESFSMPVGIFDRFAGDEWDELDIKKLDEVGNLEDWQMYLQRVFVEALWQDKLPYHLLEHGQNSSRAVRKFTSNGALLNGMVAMLGRPRYRQIRTRPNSCEDSKRALLKQADGLCFEQSTQGIYRGPSGEIEDRASFECTLQNGTTQVFDWQEGTGDALGIWGRFGFYRSGGFSVVLPSNRTEAEQLLSDLDACSFISLNTRVAILEFTLYSRSQQLFSHGTVFLELTSAGGIVPGSQWETRKLVSYHTEMGVEDVVVEALWLAGVIMYILAELTSMCFERWEETNSKTFDTTPHVWWLSIKETRHAERLCYDPKEFKIVLTVPPMIRNTRFLPFGWSLCVRKTGMRISPYFADVFNYVDLVIMSLICCLLAIHVMMVTRVSEMVASWHDLAVSEEYVDIADLLRLAAWRQYILAVTVLLCYIKSLEHLQVSAQLAIPVLIIGGMLTRLVSFFFIFAVFILAFSMCDFILYGLVYEPSSTIVRSIISTFRASLGDLDFDARYHLDMSFSIFLTCLSAFLLVILLLNLLIAIMSEAFDEIKETAEARWCYMQFRMIVKHQRRNSRLKVFRKKSHDEEEAKEALRLQKKTKETESLFTKKTREGNGGKEGDNKLHESPSTLFLSSKNDNDADQYYAKLAAFLRNRAQGAKVTPE